MARQADIEHQHRRKNCSEGSKHGRERVSDGAMPNSMSMFDMPTR
jgi:hypothetical protein